MSFYDHPTFLNKEEEHLAHLTCHSPSILHYLGRSFSTLLGRVKNELDQFEGVESVLETIS